MEAKPASVGIFARYLQEFKSIREFFTSAIVSSFNDDYVVRLKKILT
ncbi:hypothetical protein [Photobacterium iliopiscarium]